MPGLTVNAKDNLMSNDMEELITDTIIKVKNSGEMWSMAEARTM